MAFGKVAFFVVLMIGSFYGGFEVSRYLGMKSFSENLLWVQQDLNSANIKVSKIATNLISKGCAEDAKDVLNWWIAQSESSLESLSRNGGEGDASKEDREALPNEMPMGNCGRAG